VWLILKVKRNRKVGDEGAGRLETPGSLRRFSALSAL